jgi:serine/threonine protein kinase/formylglycine-generating enzyme required for sulfatase activity
LRFFGDRGTLVVGPAHAPETTVMTRDVSVRLPAANMSSGSTRGSLPGTSMSRPDALGRNAVSSIRGGGGDGDGLEPGDWIPPNSFDEYRLIRLLGRGSMGSVYLAHDDLLDRSVAVKFVGNVAPDAEDRERFLVEARAVARIQHPNVMVIYRVGELDGHPFLITEYIRGKSLADLAVPLPWRKVLELGIGLARGLATAHRMGVLHRDIKLANAVLSEDGEVKLLDFSLAKLIDVSAAEPEPEQIDEADVGASMRAALAAVERHLGEGRGPRVDRMAETVKVAAALGISTEAALDPSPPTGEPSGAWMRRAVSLTQAGTLLGTPHYMAPELWRAEQASRRSDVYALGVLLYILCAGRPPTEATSPVELATRVQEQEPQPLLERAPRVDPRLAAIVDRCLHRDPFARFGSADDLRAALEQLTPMGRELAIPEGNPYRGLQAFEAQHRALFFGRSVEIRSVVERLRSDALVVVAGDSGAGKSSLCRAGVLPVIEEGGIEPGRSWASAAMTPGRYPLQTLTVTLAVLFDMTEETVAALIIDGSDALIRGMRKQLGDVRGRLLFVDQLEELVTLGEPKEVATVGLVLARMASGIPGLRVLTTVRGDFLTRVAQIPTLGDEIGRAIYLLRQLSPENAREAIVGPAQTKAVSFESEALVDELVKSGSGGSLPLLQFALAELWEIREKASAMITAADLAKIGGVTGALARHGDGALAQLLPAQRRAGRRVLMRLVTLDDTRASLSEDELVAGEAAAKAALSALVQARLVVVREVGDRVVYEIAHEALLAGWTTLRGWLDEERESRAVRHRLELAVADWERLGRSNDGLWTTVQLKESALLEPETLRAKEREFLDASRTAMARGRRLRRAAIVLLPAIAVLTYGGLWLKGQVELGRKIDEHVATAAQKIDDAEQLQRSADVLRAQALELFDGAKAVAAESLWEQYGGDMARIDTSLGQAGSELESALVLDASREDVRASLAEVLFKRMLVVEQMHETRRLDEMQARLELYDVEGTLWRRWTAPAELSVTSVPAGAVATLERYDPGPQGRRVPTFMRNVDTTEPSTVSLGSGSYRLIFQLPGHETVYYPLSVTRGERLAVAVTMPRKETLPPGFVYIPAGRFLHGSNDLEPIRSFFAADPGRPVETGAFLIARHETTNAEYIEYLEALTPEARAARLGPEVARWEAGLGLTQLPDGEWQFELKLGEEVQTALRHEKVRLPGELGVDWLSLPVAGLTWFEADAYVHWLDRGGKRPGARLCSEREWERAARGADDRKFPHGDDLAVGDANFGTQQAGVVMAPSVIGSYPLSESPFGVLDMAGSVVEWVSCQDDSRGQVARGGGFLFDKNSAAILNRAPLDPTIRIVKAGLRVCMPAPTAP